MTLSAEHTAARRAVARAHHPDVGGDPDVYAAELAAVERRFVTAPATFGTAPATFGTEPSTFEPITFRRSVWKHRKRSVTTAVVRSLNRVRSKRYFEI